MKMVLTLVLRAAFLFALSWTFSGFKCEDEHFVLIFTWLVHGILPNE